jgi:hypothetical protein
MQIQLLEKAALKRAEGCAAGHNRRPFTFRSWLRRKSVTKNFVEKAARKNSFRGKAQRYGVRQAYRVFRIRESGFMRQQESLVENGVGSQQR